MVRETRHLWVGNLPDNIREDRIREHFKRGDSLARSSTDCRDRTCGTDPRPSGPTFRTVRSYTYGRVQNVKLLGRTENATIGVGSSGNSGICATVAFMDIKSASKAHNAEHLLDERTLTTEYYEPAAIPSAAGAPSAGSSPAGSGYSGSSSSVNSTPAPASVSRYHMTGGEDGTGNTCPLAASAAAPATWRGTNDSATEYCRRGNTPAAYGRYQRNNSTAPYATPPSNVERTTPHHRWYASGERATGATGGESTPSTPGGGTESGRRRRHSGSGSSRSESSSPEPSDTSRASTPAAQPPLPHHANHRTPHQNQHQWAAATSGRTLAICVRNLPTRSTDSSLKDGLYHEYKKHGKVMWVKVVGQNADRYAVVRFKKPSDVEKALEVSQDKLFFGCKISVAPHQSCDEDADSAKPYETDIDEYHPKATRTLFIGNLEKDVTQQQLRDKFKHFGRIIEIDIKKGSGGGAGYAFCQYASISSVVEAIRAMDGEYVGGSRVKLGFGKPVATTCVWVDGLTEHTEKQVLGAVSRCGVATSVCVDRAAGAALVHFEQVAAAGAAVRELRRVAAAVSAAEPDHPRLCVDYASRECQEAFYEQLEKHGGTAALAGSERLVGDVPTRYLPSTRHDSLRYENCGSRSRASSYGRGSSRTPRYSTVEHYDPTDYAADRRYRVYDEVGSSPQTEEAPYEDRLQSVVVSPHRARRHRRDSSPEDRKHSKERHPRIGGRRSRSGSRGVLGERHGARRRHRRRRDGSGSRAGTPLRDEPDALPVEPRRPPRERPPLPMSLPLPKFAVQLLRAAPPPPRAQPAPAPDSPPRPPSASSSSTGSAPHSPSLEERIRSLDEKYEKWSGSRTSADAPDRTRLRHRLLDVDINEVKPSEVVRSLLAKRSVFDEDSERLEGAVRAPSPTDSPRSRSSSSRGIRLPYSTHSPHLSLGHLGLTSHSQNHTSNSIDSEVDMADRPADPRLNRPERPIKFEKLGKFNESDYKLDSRIRPRTPSTDRSQPDSSGRLSPATPRDTLDDPKEEINRRQRDSFPGNTDPERKKSIDFDNKDCRGSVESMDTDIKTKLSIELDTSNSSQSNICENKVSLSLTLKTENIQEDKKSVDQALVFHTEEKSAHDVMELLINRVEQRYDSSKLESKIDQSNDYLTSDKSTLLPGYHERTENRSKVDIEHNIKVVSQSMNDSEKNTETLITNHVSKETSDSDVHHKHFNSINVNKETYEFTSDLVKACDKNGKERYNHNILDVLHNTKLEKENIHFEKTFEKEKYVNNIKQHISVDKKSDNEKHDDRLKNERDKLRHGKERSEKERHEHEKIKGRTDKVSEKTEKKSKEDVFVDKYVEKVDKIKPEKEDKPQKEKKDDRDVEKSNKHFEEKISRYDQHRKEKNDKDKRKESVDEMKLKKDEKHRHDRSKKDNDTKKENKKDSEFIKMRKSSRDETTREIARKDSTDSSASRTSHDSVRLKDLENIDVKEDIKLKLKQTDLFGKLDNDKDFLSKSVDIKGENLKIKIESREDKDSLDIHAKTKTENIDGNFKIKSDFSEKQRHYSLDSPSVDTKRKERLNSCSSLPSNIGHKRRISSHDSIDSIIDDNKKSKNDSKVSERRDSKDSKSSDRHKTAKFNKGHFAKIIESKTKDDKKNQVKPPDDAFVDFKENDAKDKHVDRNKSVKITSKEEDEKPNDVQPEGLHKDLDFLATLELRSSEEDERQKALRKEMKEKKRIQQLQQIQELQMQQDALQQAELMIKNKDDKKLKCDEKKKDAAREKRMSIDRKSREEKSECSKRKNRKHAQTSDSSDSDEPKKHSIFDIIDDGPTYISMYDKVKARSCKNMQKQEEEKRQEKIKAKFSQLKQSRAKREEKKRSSWDEDSDSDQDKKKASKSSINSSDEENILINKRHEKSHLNNSDCDTKKSDEFFDVTSNEENMSNKLSRKNSRTRIMSDTSDDDTPKRSVSKSPLFLNEIKKEPLSDSDSMFVNKNDGKSSDKESSERKIKKNSLLNLFGKSDCDESKTNCSTDMDREYKSSFVKSLSNDFSSENESIISSRNIIDIRKKHKKKQKKHKFLYSDDESSKGETRDLVSLDGDNKHKSVEKQRRHSNKKDKRKEKTRESIDTDDTRDEKVKFRKGRRSPNNNCFDFVSESSSSNVKKDGKMEDIFGPLSDESDKDTKVHSKPKSDFSSREYDSNGKNDIESKINNGENKTKEKEENRRRKEKKRKERRLFKEDDNSLDVDAVSKAIEARLFAESVTDEDNRLRIELPEGPDKSDHMETSFIDSNLISEFMKQEKMKKDCKEKKKKKKRSKEDRPTRKDHHFYHHDKIDRSENITDDSIPASPPKPAILDIPLPKESPTMPVVDKSDDCKSLAESPSLPRLTDSPPTLTPTVNSDTTKNGPDISTNDDEDIDEMTIHIPGSIIDIQAIPMPPTQEILAKPIDNVNEIPLPPDNVPQTSSEYKVDLFKQFTSNISEDAVRSICNIENDVDKIVDKVTTEKIETRNNKVEKKPDEKPRAVISQEETEDAVAALLGESFGGKADNFANRYEEPETVCGSENEIVSVNIETENIPEEDAEEMRQAVQNLNASEMEMKPDTPVSDNDLLLIDTDTEDVEEHSQDAIDRLPINIMATNQALNTSNENPKPAEVSNIVTAKPKTPSIQTVVPNASETTAKVSDTEVKFQLAKRENVPIMTSAATPVITSWTLSNNKLIEPHVVNIQPNQGVNRDKSESKATHITANILQIKAPQNQNAPINNAVRPIVAPARVSAPYQVINQMIRPPVSNIQPPTIKIPESHILYQKQQGIVISPRMSNDTRLLSPKTSPQGENITSPRRTNVAILNTSPQNINSVGGVSPNTIPQRSPGQVTVVRMQQPPLSPIQTVHLPHGARTMVSPNRPNSVLVQAQGSPIHFNRLPVTPVLTPISKQMNASNIVQQTTSVNVTSPLGQQQKVIANEQRKNDQNVISENIKETSKIILSPTNIQSCANPTVMAQNRLISMQNAIHVASINSPSHVNNKVLVNSVSQINDKRENQPAKLEQLNHGTFCPTPIIHVAGVNHSTGSIIQGGGKPVVCSLQDSNSVTRGQGANVIHTVNSQRLLTSAPLAKVIQIESNKGPPSVLSMATIKPPSVLTKVETSNASIVTANHVSTVSQLLLKTSSQNEVIRLNTKDDKEPQHNISLQNHTPREKDVKTETDLKRDTGFKQNAVESSKSPVENFSKGDTDFEELLKDNTNEIKITNDPEKKLEVNVGKTVTLFTTNKSNYETGKNIEHPKKENDVEKSCDLTISEESLSQQEFDDKEDKNIMNCDTFKLTSEDNIGANTEIKSEEDNISEKDVVLENTDLKIAVIKEETTQSLVVNFNKLDDIKPLDVTSDNSESTDNQIKCLEENDSWSAKDLNIESVIKKVDSLCNETTEPIDIKHDNGKEIDKPTLINPARSPVLEIVTEKLSNKPSDNFEFEIASDIKLSPETVVDKFSPVAKRGGRTIRGKKIEKAQDRVQTRQISKPSRGGTTAKRGRGRAKVDKKIKILAKNNASTIPGDVYDFHEDSGDETATSSNKVETRPRLILTIKSPLSGHTNMTATSTLSITPKDIKTGEKTNKEEKGEDFILPSPSTINTRKSRRLQEKDIQRSTVDDVIEDVVKVVNSTPKIVKENKKRPTRQTGAKLNLQDKVITIDTRKSPRGVKRTRDRSLSDASIDSGDEKMFKSEDCVIEAKVPRMQEPTVIARDESMQIGHTRTITAVPTSNSNPTPASTSIPASSLLTGTNLGPVQHQTPVSISTTPVIVSQTIASSVPTPITKPPKKMISEISAKLACAFEAQQQVERAQAAPGGEGRERDSVPPALVPVGATEATDARVQSPALPHRPPSAPATPAPLRPADRATPVLVRSGEGEGVGGSSGGGGVGARAYRAYAGGASLPRGAHHPPAEPPGSHAALAAQAAHAAQMAQAAQAAHAKQVAVVGPHPRPQHPGAPSRITITSVPSISPQSQMTIGDGMYSHFSHQHYQMYQQHFRATQHENRTTPSPYPRSLEAEGCEAPTPPLELRRPPGARVPRPAHSPRHPLADELRFNTTRVVVRSPPPAHGPATGAAPAPAAPAAAPLAPHALAGAHGLHGRHVGAQVARLVGALPPAGAPGPPHASQVPREADSLQMLLRRYPVMWQGLLALKNDSAAVQMHFVGGNPGVAGDTLSRHGTTPLLRIAQRMRLEPQQLDQVHRKMKLENEHCMLLALPCGRDHMDVLQQSTNLTVGFITYLQRKQAAGIVNIAPPGHQQAMFTVHIFPSCDFANENLTRIAPDLMHRVADIAHLLIVIATV